MATFTQTARFALRWLTGANNVNDIDAGFQALAEDVDTNMAGWLHGPIGSRPTSTAGSPGKAGRIYFADDTGQAFLDTGTSWLEFTLGGAPVSVPTATVLGFGGSSAPSGYLLCDGTAKDRTTYAALFAAIGTAHGAGNGTTTFNVPDLRGRVPVGVDAGTGRLSAANALGQAGGAEQVALSVTQMPAHNHAGLTGAMNQNQSHFHGQNANTAVGGAVPLRTSGGAWQANQVTTGGVSTVISPYTISGAITESSGTSSVNTDHAHSISSQGGGGAHANMPPYAIVSYIIKA